MDWITVMAYLWSSWLFVEIFWCYEDIPNKNLNSEGEKQATYPVGALSRHRAHF
jgi:hypothetical protein